MLGWQGVCGFTTEHKSLCRREQSGHAEVCPVVLEGSAHGGLRPGFQPGGAVTAPSPLHRWWRVQPPSKALALKGSDGPFAWGGGREQWALGPRGHMCSGSVLYFSFLLHFLGVLNLVRQDVMGRRVGREQRRKATGWKMGKWERGSVTEGFPGSKKKKTKKDFYCDIAINNHSVLVKIILAEGSRNWTNSGLSGSGFIFLKQET